MTDWIKATATSAPAWDFEKTKECEGLYTGKTEKVGPNNSNLYNFEKKDGTTFSVWGNTLLDRIFQGISVGEEVKIEYLGKAKSEKTGREYKNFDVFHRVIEEKS